MNCGSHSLTACGLV